MDYSNPKPIPGVRVLDNNPRSLVGYTCHSFSGESFHLPSRMSLRWPVPAGAVRPPMSAVSARQAPFQALNPAWARNITRCRRYLQMGRDPCRRAHGWIRPRSPAGFQCGIIDAVGQMGNHPHCCGRWVDLLFSLFGAIGGHYLSRPPKSFSMPETRSSNAFFFASSSLMSSSSWKSCSLKVVVLDVPRTVFSPSSSGLFVSSS